MASWEITKESEYIGPKKNYNAFVSSEIISLHFLC